MAQGLSAGIAGFHEGGLIYAGGSNFDRPKWEGGSKTFYRGIYMLSQPRVAGSRWKRVGELPHPLADAATVELPDGLLCIGGTDGKTVFSGVFLLRWTGHTVRFDASRFPALPEETADAAAAVLGSSVYVMGGKDADGKALHTAWRLNLRHPRRWEVVAPWPGPARFGANLIVQSDGRHEELYLLSGKSDHDYLSDGYRFDTRTATWQAIHPLPHAALLAPATALGASEILVFSGSDGHDLEKIASIRGDDDYHFSPEILVYHTTEDTWSAGGKMPRGLVGSRALLQGTQLWIVGGEIGPSVRTPAVQIFETEEKPSARHE